MAEQATVKTPRHGEAITLRALWQALPRSVVWATLAACATLMAGIGLLAVSGWFITATAVAGASVATALAFDVFRPSAGIRLLALGRTVSRYAERVWGHDAILVALAAMRERLFCAWATPRGAWALRLEPARMLFRLTGDLDALESVALRFAVPALAAIPACLLAGALLGMLSPAIGVATVVLLALGAVAITVRVMRASTLTAARRASRMERMRAATIDFVSGQTALLMSGRLDAQGRRVRALEEQLAEQDRRLNRVDTTAAAATTVLGGGLLAATVAGAAHLVAGGHVAAPIGVMAILAAVGVMEPFAALRRGALETGRALLGARRLSARLADSGEPETQGRAASGEAARAPVAPGCVLSMRGVDACYPRSRAPAVRGIALQVWQGERVALIGASGSGKSTVLALAMGELAPSAGEVSGCRASLIAQNVDLFLDTVRNNLLLADPHADDATLWRVLEAVGLADAIAATGRGLDSRLGEGGLGLSGGQARRLAIARMLLQQHPLWLLDEPTESLDDETASHVLRTLSRAGGDRGWLMATHLHREAVLADRVVRIANGVIVEEGRRGTTAYARMVNELRGGSAHVPSDRPECALASENLPWN